MAFRLTKKKTLAIGAAVVLLGIGATGAAIASDDDDATEQPIPGSALDRATEAALAETGEGKVTGTEVDDEESKYEVEVTLDDGSQVDVQLDENFDVVSSEDDDEESGDD